MTELEYLIFIICGVGLAYTSYRIGWREGSGAMVDYVKSKRNREVIQRCISSAII